MKYRVAAFAFLLAAAPAWALDTNLAFRIDAEVQTAGMQSLPDITWIQGSTPAIEYRILRNGKASALSTNVRARMLIASNLATATTYAQVTNSILTTNTTASSIWMQWGTIGTNTCGTGTTAGAWGYLVFFEDASTGTRYWNGSGNLYIEKSTAAGADGLVWQTAATTITGLVVNGTVATQTNGTLYVNVTAAEAPDLTARASIVVVGESATNAQNVASNAFNAITNQPRVGWSVWADENTNYFARSYDHKSGYTNASFSSVMNWVITNAGEAAVVEIGPTVQGTRTIKYEIDAPIYMVRRDNFVGMTWRGQGDYGTYVGPKSDYTGEQIVSTGRCGILRFQNIRFDGFGSANTNPILDVKGSAELVVESCEFAQTAGTAVRYGTELLGGNIGWNYFSDTWFYGTRHSAPLVDLSAANGNVVQDFQFDNCHFYVRSNFPAILVRTGSVNHVQVNGTHFLDDNAARTEPIVDFRSGVGHIVNGCVFVGLAGSEPGVRFAAATSNNFRGAVVGNSFSTSTSTNLVVVTSDSHGVVIAANHGSEGNVNVEGQNAMGWVFRGYGVTAHNAARGDWFASLSNSSIRGATVAEGALGVTTNAGVLALTIPAAVEGSGIDATAATGIAQAVSTSYGFATTSSVQEIAGQAATNVAAALRIGSWPCVEIVVTSANSTVSLSTTNKAWRVRAVSPGTITNWAVTGVSTASLDWCGVVLEPGPATDFSWKGLRTNVPLPAAYSTNVYFPWRGPGSDYWTVD